MTSEEAIKALRIMEHVESIVATYEPGEVRSNTTVRELKEAFRVAISALRAQQSRTLCWSRWEGCPHCTFGTEGLLRREVKYGWKRGKSVISGADEMYIIRYGDKDYSLICECTESNEHETEIRFCPFCGRPLTEEAWAELERRIGGNNDN